ncbi:MAG: hypothetical protein KDA58_07380 [Planctomycetaceae bacterium]|nr:hypothetical protein [Planctomycetaceae bacterium]
MPCRLFCIVFVSLFSVASLRAEETLTIPPFADIPTPGHRAAVITPEYAGTEVHHLVYLPPDWTSDWQQRGKSWPIIVEYTGNKFPAAGSTGTVEGAGLGYGISQGKFIWVVLPYINQPGTANEVTWWGDQQSTVDYAKRNVPRICKQFGGDADKVLLCGFSRGAIAVNYIGLADDDIAQLWCGFFAHDHYDGVREWRGTDWGSPLEPYQQSATERLRRLGDRPVFISHNGGVEATRQFLEPRIPLDHVTFLDPKTSEILGAFPNDTAIHPHNDRWLLVPSLAREQVHAWAELALE